MRGLSDDDLNLRDMTDEELERAWDLWFSLAQETNDSDPPYTHGVFAGMTWEKLRALDEPAVTQPAAEGKPRAAD